MRTDLFDYALPEELVAFYPPPERDGGRLMVLRSDTGERFHRAIRDLSAVLPSGALLVINDTRVIRARLQGRRPTGGSVEVLLVRMTEEHQDCCCWTALARANRPLRSGDRILFEEITAEVVARGESGETSLSFDVSESRLMEHMETHGEVPLPPYIRRPTEPADAERYQTVYARHSGSVAAPTAGLHFTAELLDELARAGNEIAHVTLHVGPGTFRPISAPSTAGHRMDEEEYVLGSEAAEKICEARKQGRPVIAVGTTVTRALEGVFAAHGRLVEGAGFTDLFITPGFSFKVVDGLLTNFHLPRSTLLCLVSALAGRERILAAYEEAVRERYRFYSYGDAMLILPGER